MREFISELRGVSASNLLMDVPWKLRPATARRPGPHKRTAHLGSAARQWAHVVHPVHPPVHHRYVEERAFFTATSATGFCAGSKR